MFLDKPKNIFLLALILNLLYQTLNLLIGLRLFKLRSKLCLIYLEKRVEK